MSKINPEEIHTDITNRLKRIKSMLPDIPGSKEEQKRLHVSDLRDFTEGMKEKDMLVRMRDGLDPIGLITDPGDAFGESGDYLSQYVLVYVDRWSFVYGQYEEEQYTTNGFLVETNRLAFNRSDYGDMTDEQFLTQMIIVLKAGLSGQIGVSVTVDDNKEPLGALLWYDDGDSEPLKLGAVWMAPGIHESGKSVHTLKNSLLPRLSAGEIAVIRSTAAGGAYRQRRDIRTPLNSSEARQHEILRRAKQYKTLKVLSIGALLLFILIQVGRFYFKESPVLFGLVAAFMALLIFMGMKVVPRFMAVAFAPILGVLASMMVVMGVPVLLYIALLSERVDDEVWGPVVIGSSILAGLVAGTITYLKLQRRFDRSTEKALRD